MNPIQQWRGQYSFAERYEALLPGGLKTVDFELSFRYRLFGFITGEIRDGADGIPEPAAVRGRIVHSKSIWFSKTYPHTWAPAAETGTLYVFDNRKHVVYYKGTFGNPTAIGGTWEIRSQRRVLNGTEYELPRLTGTWNATTNHSAREPRIEREFASESDLLNHRSREPR